MEIKDIINHLMVDCAIIREINKGSLENYENDLKQALQHLSDNEWVGKDFFENVFFANLVLSGFVSLHITEISYDPSEPSDIAIAVGINDSGKQFLKDLKKQERKLTLVNKD